MSYNNETGMYDGYIYKIQDLTTGKCYIGQTKRTIKIRYKEHCHYTEQEIDKRIQKYGKENFDVACIEVISEYDLTTLFYKLDERESYWINYYNSYYDGYNNTNGGQVDRRNYNEYSCIAYDKQGNLIGKYINYADASEKTGANRTRISKSCCSGDNFFLANNLIFRHIDDELNSDDIERIKIKYPKIYQFTFDGSLVNIFDSLVEAANYLQNNYGAKYNSRDLSAVCKKPNVSACGYVWRKYPDSFDSYDFRPQRYRVEKRDKFSGKLLETYSNCVEAGEATGHNPVTINSICNGFSKSHKEFYWCFEGRFDEDTFKYNITNSQEKPVDMLNIDGDYIRTFGSIKEACEYLGVSPTSTSISLVLKGKHKTAFGYKWRYYDPDLQQDIRI